MPTLEKKQSSSKSIKSREPSPELEVIHTDIPPHASKKNGKSSSRSQASEAEQEEYYNSLAGQIKANIGLPIIDLDAMDELEEEEAQMRATVEDPKAARADD